MLESITDIAPLLCDESKAGEMIERLRWPGGPVCPHCDSADKIYETKGPNPDRKQWKCGACRKKFSVTTGSIFEGSHIPLGKWIYAIFIMCSSKKSVSANQLKRELGISYKSAWFLCHRIRHAMSDGPLAEMLGADGGIVEADETYVGGKHRNNRHKDRTDVAGKKTAVMTLVDREGDARTFVVPNTKKSTLQSIAIPNVDGSAHIVTDENPSYRGIAKHFASHHTVDHSKQYVRAMIFHTNIAESYHSLLKRGIVGAYHHVSAKHLPRYLAEYDYRWNTRKTTDGERTLRTIRQAEGRRLMYREPVI